MNLWKHCNFSERGAEATPVWKFCIFCRVPQQCQKNMCIMKIKDTAVLMGWGKQIYIKSFHFRLREQKYVFYLGLVRGAENFLFLDRLYWQGEERGNASFGFRTRGSLDQTESLPTSLAVVALAKVTPPETSLTPIESCAFLIYSVFSVSNASLSLQHLPRPLPAVDFRGQGWRSIWV